jgi:NDP-sugar pyrophosphorylase family protein
VRAVVLAAGLGTRLRPLTYFAPKALVPVGGIPMVTRVIEWLRLNGIKDIAVVGYYMQSLLERYLAERHPDVAFLKSRRLLGTAGQLYYAREWADGSVVVVNTDVLTNLDLRAPAELHERAGALMTIVAQRVESRLRFGVLSLSGSALARWSEKPSFEYVTSAGVYIMSGDVIRRLEERYLDMDALANSLAPRVAVYVAREAFFYDVGTPEDLQRARDVAAPPLKP